tara:strand:+ start:188 stop:2953 length:2766 start_codon:yes stop_codon:yes gene_type:complete
MVYVYLFLLFVTASSSQDLNQLSILILGGNGMLGSETSLLLSSAGASVTILNRNTTYWDSNARLFQNTKTDIKHYIYDRSKKTIPTSLSTSYDVLLDFSGTESVYVDNAISKLANKIKTLWLYISTDSVYEVAGTGSNTLGLHSTTGLQEHEALRPLGLLLSTKNKTFDEYGHQKLLGEELLKNKLPSYNSNLPYVILRLPDVIGPRDNSYRSFLTSLFLRIVTDSDYGLPNVVPQIDPSKNIAYSQISLVYSLDVASLCLAIVRRVAKVNGDPNQLRKTWPAMVDHAFNVAFREKVTSNDILQHWAPTHLIDAAKNYEEYLVVENAPNLQHVTDATVQEEDREDSEEQSREAEQEQEEEEIPVMYTKVYPSVTRGSLDISAVLIEFADEWQPTSMRTAMIETDQFYMQLLFNNLKHDDSQFEKEIQKAFQHTADMLYIGQESWGNIQEWFHRLLEDKHLETQRLIEKQIRQLATVPLQTSIESKRATVPTFDTIKLHPTLHPTINTIPYTFVKRIHQKDLTRKDFLEQYFDTNTPIIIENATKHWRALHLTPEEVANQCFRSGTGRGSVTRTTRGQKKQGSHDWGHLKTVETAKKWDMHQYFSYTKQREMYLHQQQMQAQPKQKEDIQQAILDPTTSAYLTDIKLCARCSSLFHNTTVLPYFNDYKMTYSDGIPSNDTCQGNAVFAYIGGLGTGTGMHQDLNGITFWMTVLSGRKELILIDPKDYQHVQRTDQKKRRNKVCNSEGYCPHLVGEDLPDLFDQTVHERHGNLRKVTAHLVTLRPGDILFGPSNWFHQARNVQPFTFGMTGNFMHYRKKQIIRYLKNMCLNVNGFLKNKSALDLKKCRTAVNRIEQEHENANLYNFDHSHSTDVVWDALNFTEEEMNLVSNAMSDKESSWLKYYELGQTLMRNLKKDEQRDEL